MTNKQIKQTWDFYREQFKNEIKDEIKDEIRKEIGAELEKEMKEEIGQLREAIIMIKENEYKINKERVSNEQ